jgi:hypothetical protein
MNYKEFQERKTNKEKTPLEKKKFIREKKPFNWEVLSDTANPFSVLAVISMIIFFKSHPIIPGFFCLITFGLFMIRFKKGKCPGWIPIIWMVNFIIWLSNSLLKL